MKKTILTLFFLLFGIIIRADDGNNGDSNLNYPETSLKPGTGNKPKTPFYYDISCYIQEGELYFIFDEIISPLNITVEDSTGIMTSCVIFDNNEFISIPYANQYLYITAITNLGITYWVKIPIL